MEKPRVYANPINKKIDNVQDLFRSDKDSRSINPVDVNKKINEIFASRNHVYKSKVRITLKDAVVEKEIVGKTNINLLTLDGNLIRITDIVDIERI
ncbi:MAG TPA: hypothetical protein IAB40_03615 [Candidatus Onthocola stercoravium]|nr:hypothetical protein [Candidatus Onthocola stercoravium]